MLGSEKKVVRKGCDVAMQDQQRGTKDSEFCAREDQIDRDGEHGDRIGDSAGQRDVLRGGVSEAGMVDTEQNQYDFLETGKMVRGPRG